MEQIKQYNDSKKYLAKCHNFDIGMEDHGWLVVFGEFEYEDGGCQGLRYFAHSSFIMRLLAAVGVDKVRELNGKSCWVTATYDKILKIEPLHKKEGRPFDIQEWQDWFNKRCKNDVSPSEMLTGRNPNKRE